MKQNIQLSRTLWLPVDIVTQTIAILAKRRAGKSYTMRRLVEQLFRAHQQVVLVDPKGDQWGIRSSADGKKPGLPILILGGEHGDLPLEVSSGEVVARLVVEERVSVLLDLSQFRKHEVATFMTAFMENLYRLKAREQYRTPLMLVIDEADAVAPQKPQKGEERMLGAAEDIVRRGGQRGIGCTLVTQRSAVLNKNVLTQAQMLVVLRTIAPQDLAAMKAWIEVHGTIEEGRELMESLPSLPVGDAWFWSPGWPTDKGIFQRAHVLPIDTFDSGATPKPGEKLVIPKNLADVDLNALKGQMAATIEKAKADNPKELKKKINEQAGIILLLEEHIKKEKPAAEPGPMGVSQWMNYRKKYGYDKFFEAVYKKEAGLEWEKLVKEWQAFVQKHLNSIEKFKEIIVTPKTFENMEFKVNVNLANVNLPIKKREQKDKFYSKVLATFASESESKIGAGERKVLIALGQHQDGMTRAHLTVQINYKQSARDTFISRLKSRGFVEQSGNKIKITQAGIAELGSDYNPNPPTGDEMRELLLRTLTGGELKIFEFLLRHPGGFSRDEISEQVGYKQSARDTFISRLKTRELITLESGRVKAISLFFE